MRTPTALISGASIAGPALAYWLNARGWRTTVVERFDALRDDGQNIDVRGAGREVARRMGIEDAIRAASTGETGTEFVDASGAAIARFAAGTTDSGGATAELEILRGQLSRILVDRTAKDTEYVFGDRITALDEQGTGTGNEDGVTVSFAHGPARTFDVVAVAEGLRSRTRSLVFPGTRAVHELGFYIAYLTIPRTTADTDLWRWHSAGRGRSVTLRPDNLGTIRAPSPSCPTSGAWTNSTATASSRSCDALSPTWAGRRPACSPPSTTPLSTSTPSARPACPPGAADAPSSSETPPTARPPSVE
ncbi:FAD-dependent monooxygenase [Streptomyces lavendulae]|uniref:FAD-dependent monooxygenase n=1 Tax=Streptomyces lavendulae TaxID=1914 RepID=UPI0036EF313B